MEILKENQPEEEATDMERALYYAGHIDKPCQVEVEPGKFENIREYWLREAKKTLSDLTEPDARRFLEDKIKEYAERD